MTLARLICVSFLGGTLAGCGVHATDAVRPLYAGTVEACYQRQRAIVEREGSTEAEDRADVATIRAKCDRAYEGIEASAELLEVAFVRGEEP